MKVAIRYYSRTGHVKLLAEALARGAGVEAISIDEPGAMLTEPVDVLFIGGGLYYFQIDQKLKDYIAALPEGIVTDRAVCFGSSLFTRRPVYMIQEKIKERGITVAPQALYARNNPRKLILEAAEIFGEMEANRDPNEEKERPKPYVYWTTAEKRREAAKEEAAKAEAEADEDDAEAEIDNSVDANAEATVDSESAAEVQPQDVTDEGE